MSDKAGGARRGQGRVLVDARWRGQTGGSGIATYGEVLADALTLAGLSPELLSDGPLRPRWRRWPSAALPIARRAEPVPGGWRAADVFREAREHFAVTGRLLSLALPSPPAIAHWTLPLPLKLRGAINIYTLHDAIPLDQPELTDMHRSRHRKLLRAVAARADHLVTVSETARSTLIAALGLDPRRITAVFPAGAGLPADPPPHPGFASGSYYLALGRLDRRKNLPRLMAAHAVSGTARPLLLAGPGGDETAGLDGDGVIRLGWRPLGEIASLLAHARGLLMPSLAEGFGLPIVEAFALGTPVLTSARGATAEVAGAAAVLVDPASVDAIAEGIALLERDDIAATLRVAGQQRAEIFTLRAYAERLATLYRSLEDRVRAGK